MQTNYDEPRRPIGTKLAYPVAVWRDEEAGEQYAMPIGQVAWRGPTPLTSSNRWTPLGVLPKGLSITDGQPSERDDFVRCEVASVRVLIPYDGLER